MIIPSNEKLTKNILNNIILTDIVYVECAEGGASGGAGDFMLYLIQEEKIICYETNFFNDAEVYTQAKELILKHSDHIVDLPENLFYDYYGGLGHNVFINKNFMLGLGDGYLIYKHNNNHLFQISPSSLGTFINIVYEMNNPFPIELFLQQLKASKS